jgi:predicted Zn-dependent peptidase
MSTVHRLYNIHTFPNGLYNIHTFPNGFRMIYEKSINTYPITSIQTICDLGSVHEPAHLRGVSHFIEHMCFKGTRKLHSIDIFKEYDNTGAYINASTFKRYTNYVINCHDEHVKVSLETLADMLLNSVFEKKEYEKEIKVVIEENIKDMDDSENIIDDLMDSIVYKGSSYENPIDTISYHKRGSLKYNDVIDFYKVFYQPNNLILSIVSNLSFSTIVKYIESSFFIKKSETSLTELNKNNYLLHVPFKIQREPQYITKKINQSSSTYLTIAFRTCSQNSPDKYVLNLLKKMLAGYFSSKLFMLLREDNGLTYTSSVYTQYYENLGDFTITAITDPNKLFRNGKKLGVLPLIINMLNEMIEKGVTNDELILCKNYMRGHFALKMKDNYASAIHNAEYMLMYSGIHEYIPYKNMYDAYYKNITREQIHDVIRKYLKKENMTICVAGEHNPTIASIKKQGDKLLI